MKKIVSLFAIFALLISTTLCVYGDSAGSSTYILKSTDSVISEFSPKIANMIREKIDSGATVYYGEGTDTPVPINTVVNLPASGATIDFNMSYGNTYYSPYTFYATENCDMQIYRTCGEWHNPCNIKLTVYDETLGKEKFSKNLDVDKEGATISIYLSKGHSYSFYVDPLTAGESHVAFYVYGE